MKIHIIKQRPKVPSDITGHSITNQTADMPREDSDNLRIHVRLDWTVFAVNLKALRIFGCYQQSALRWPDAQADLSLCWTHIDYCRKCCDLYHISFRYIHTIWCAAHVKGPYTICEQRRSRSACAFVQSDYSILCSSTYTTVSIDSVSGQWRPWSACANAQADLGLRCPQIAWGPFMCVAHHMQLLTYDYVLILYIQSVVICIIQRQIFNCVE